MQPDDKLSQFLLIEHTPSKDRHEDSYCFDFSRRDMHLLAVFDGCGGLGARHYPALADRTGAFIAAQTCARIVGNRFDRLSPEDLSDTAQFAQSLCAKITADLTRLEENFADKNKLLGSMVRTMPCTASVALVHPGVLPESLSVTALNAGDSRVYVLTAEGGLMQLTRDDLRGEPDALMNLYVSAPLSNVINIDEPFSLRVRSVDYTIPFAVLTASDGVFSYVRTPMDFENLLLRSLTDAASFEEFEAAFREGVSAIAGDDATAVMAFYGWKHFSDLQKSFAKRSRAVSEICARLDEGPSDDAIEDAWLKYKPGAYV